MNRRKMRKFTKCLGQGHRSKCDARIQMVRNNPGLQNTGIKNTQRIKLAFRDTEQTMSVGDIKSRLEFLAYERQPRLLLHSGNEKYLKYNELDISLMDAACFVMGDRDWEAWQSVKIAPSIVLSTVEEIVSGRRDLDIDGQFYCGCSIQWAMDAIRSFGSPKSVLEASELFKAFDEGNPVSIVQPIFGLMKRHGMSISIIQPNCAWNEMRYKLNFRCRQSRIHIYEYLEYGEIGLESGIVVMDFDEFRNEEIFVGMPAGAHPSFFQKVA